MCVCVSPQELFWLSVNGSGETESARNTHTYRGCCVCECIYNSNSSTPCIICLCICVHVCLCVCVQPLELIKNVCCNLFYYGGHLWLHIHLGQPIPNTSSHSQLQSLPPHGIIPERVVITFAVLFQMHFYLPNKSNFRFSLESSTRSECVGVGVCVFECIPGHQRGCDLGGIAALEARCAFVYAEM